jgi:hypothetical protein
MACRSTSTKCAAGMLAALVVGGSIHGCATSDEERSRPGAATGGDADSDGDVELGDSSGTDGSGSGSSGGFEACATATEAALLAPVSVFLTIDKSISMQSDGKWLTVQEAFQAFFASPEADSLDLALRFWGGEGCDGHTCDAVACGVPQISLGSMSDAAHEQALIDLLLGTEPEGGTPMSAALAGACLWAKENKASSEGAGKFVVVLVTDGKPAKCETNIEDVAKYAAECFAEDVLTFVVGIAGSEEEQIDTIAAAGGTDGFFIGATGPDAATELIAALLEISQATLACSFALPESGDAGMQVDPTLVNVTYTPGAGQSEILKQVSDEAACAGAGGWYYDDPSAPALIVLCPATCSAVQADDAGALEIVLGCVTQAE